MESLQAIWEQLNALWDTQVLGVPVGHILTSLLILLAAYGLRVPIANLLNASIRWLFRDLHHPLLQPLLHAIRRPSRLLVLALAVQFAVSVGEFPDTTVTYANDISRSLLLIFVFWSGLRMVDPLTSNALHHLTRRTSDTALQDFAAGVLRTVIFLVGLSSILELWGFHVVAVLGSLGILGAAIALGAKDLFSDLLAGVVLLVERTADRGDWIRTDQVDGTVERIGLRSTLVRRFDKTLTSVPNRLLSDNAIINFTRMTQRRIYWTIGLEYKSSESQLKSIVREISEFLHGHEGFETDPAKVLTFVFVDSFGDSSINVMLYCFTRTTDWGEWLALKEELAYAVKRIVESHGVGFAFPSTSLYVESLPFGSPEPFPAP